MPSLGSKTKSGAIAVHAQTKDGTRHAVGIGNLRVLLVNDDGSWFAQGLEIDYAAQGEDAEDAKRRFEDGLAQTVSEHLRVFGGIEKLLSPAPAVVWQQLGARACERQQFTQVTIHKVDTLPTALPFEGISYIEARA